MKVIYNGEECTFTWSTGKVWREPESGIRTELCQDTGIEYDLTDYIEDEGWFITNKNGEEINCYKSECKILEI